MYSQIKAQKYSSSPLNLLKLTLCLSLFCSFGVTMLNGMERGPKGKGPDIEEISQEAEFTDIEQEVIAVLSQLKHAHKRKPASSSSTSSSSNRSNKRKRIRSLTVEQQSLRTDVIETLELVFNEYTNQDRAPEELEQLRPLLVRALEEYDDEMVGLDTLGTRELGIAHRAIIHRNPLVLEILLSLQPNLLRSQTHPLRLTPLQLLLQSYSNDPLFMTLLIVILNAANELPENTTFEEVVNYNNDIVLEVLIHQLYLLGRQHNHPTMALPLVRRLEAVDPARVIRITNAITNQIKALGTATSNLLLLLNASSNQSVVEQQSELQNSIQHATNNNQTNSSTTEHHAQYTLANSISTSLFSLPPSQY
jgi:hypothetical protein